MRKDESKCEENTQITESRLIFVRKITERTYIFIEKEEKYILELSNEISPLSENI